MKKVNIAYWIITIILAAFIILGAIPDLLSMPMAAEIFNKLHQPAYMMPFLGAAKILGMIAILIPGNFPRIKEWAYAGLFFDLIGAFYSGAALGMAVESLPILIGVAFILASYFLYHKKLSLQKTK
jgi:hypothetical protein